MLLPYPLHWNLMTLILLAFKCFRKLSLLSLLTLLCLVRLLTVPSFSKTCFTFSVKALPLLEPCILDWSLFCPRIFALFFLNLWVVSFWGRLPCWFSWHHMICSLGLNSRCLQMSISVVMCQPDMELVFMSSSVLIPYIALLLLFITGTTIYILINTGNRLLIHLPHLISNWVVRIWFPWSI